MGELITIGVDLAKSVFQVHGVDAEGAVVVRRQLRRGEVVPFFEKLPACLVEMEACATAHHWGREIQRLGHRVRLMPPRYVKAYVKTQKNDAADAEAICEAVTRPTMRFVEIKSCEQQSVLILHRTRQMFVRQRTTLINAIRAHLAEFGVVAPIGRNGVEALLRTIGEHEDDRVPEVARSCLEALVGQLHLVKHQILDADRRILAWHRSNEISRRLDSIPGVGPLVATALVASVPNPQAFKSGRDLAAWIGLVPKQSSSGGKERLGGISKHGNRYLRMLLTVGAFAVIRYAQTHGTAHRPWLARLLERRPAKVAAVALANKIARMAWAVMARGEAYREPTLQTA
jgi:transposase